ncbi:fatty acid desaturase [Azohydromonas sp. G-1-1-14]|uniref:Fatty acid desaturase n=2 Tax=Azohydromonas caseinilytica TaxID=2728836 RepID=A0A848FB05_9BURK|nr:fatty acid desaturase [Azohydromonas caseinilytica]
MELQAGVHKDVIEFLSQLRRHCPEYQELLRLAPARAARDIAFDWAVILGSVAFVVFWSPWLTPVALCLIGHRQRALGNLLHDAGHRSLWRQPRLNDWVTRLLVAPMLFADLEHYRNTHFLHHRALGRAGVDPDFLPPPATPVRHWLQSYLRLVTMRRLWLASLAGHLADAGVRPANRLCILAWWAGVLALAGAWGGAAYAGALLGLTLLARATVFHLLTMLREMCDHYGLQPGEVFSFSRDMSCTGLARLVVHPRNNGYHLTHHLLPAVPYYRLRQAHALFQQLPMYRARAQQCRAYFFGDGAVARAWQAAAPGSMKPAMGQIF